MQHFPILFFTLILALAVRVQSSNTSNISWPIPGTRPKLEIWPELVGAEFDQKVLLHKKDEPLNMTCTVVYPYEEQNTKPVSNYTVDWKVPSHIKNDKETKIEHGQGPNMAWLWFERLTETYAGDYNCMAIASPSNKILSIKIHLSVKHSKIRYCNPLWFRCHSSLRIPNRYLCDGKADCEEGEDETIEAGCGPDPCADKIFCGERCIPSEWCCDQYNYLYNCSLKSPYTRPNEAMINPTFSDISFLQATTYVLIGCAMIFIFIFTALVIAICRLQMKRAMACRLSEQLAFRAQRSVPFHDLDIYFSRSSDTNNADDSEVTYNISSAVPLTSTEPPPYSEIIFTMCNEDLPPPYESNEDLLHPGTTARSAQRRTDSSPADTSPSQSGERLERKDTGDVDMCQPNDGSYGEDTSITCKSTRPSNSEASARIPPVCRSNRTEVGSLRRVDSMGARDENVFTQAERKSLLRTGRANRRDDESDGLNVPRCCNDERTCSPRNEANAPEAETVRLLRPDVDGISCQALQMSSTVNDERAASATAGQTNLDSARGGADDER